MTQDEVMGAIAEAKLTNKELDEINAVSKRLRYLISTRQHANAIFPSIYSSIVIHSWVRLDPDTFFLGAAWMASARPNKAIMTVAGGVN